MSVKETIVSIINEAPGIRFIDLPARIRAIDNTVEDADILTTTQSLIESEELSYVGFTLPNDPREKGMLFPKGTDLIIRKS